MIFYIFAEISLTPFSKQREIEMKDLIIGIGEVLWDMLPDGRKIGGAPANFAYHVSQFGLVGCVVSAVGEDSLGREIIDVFARKGLRAHIPSVPYPTGTVDVELDSLGVPRYEIRENVAWDHIPLSDTLMEMAARTKAVCFGSLAQRSPESRATILRFLDSIPADGGCLLVFDINLRLSFYTKEILEESMRRCNVLKINDEELEIVSSLFGLPESDIESRCRRIMEIFNIEILILTCGVEGSYVFSGSEDTSFMPTPKVEVADTVGAGDSFTAAFVANLLKGRSVREAHDMAVRTSAYVCSREGAMPLLPDDITA